jgi:hypothetical protein
MTNEYVTAPVSNSGDPAHPTIGDMTLDLSELLPATEAAAPHPAGTVPQTPDAAQYLHADRGPV